jgi:hypothetical protein
MTDDRRRAGGGSTTVDAELVWVSSTFAARTVGASTVYDLTAAAAAS